MVSSVNETTEKDADIKTEINNRLYHTPLEKIDVREHLSTTK